MHSGIDGIDGTDGFFLCSDDKKKQGNQIRVLPIRVVANIRVLSIRVSPIPRISACNLSST